MSNQTTLSAAVIGTLFERLFDSLKRLDRTIVKSDVESVLQREIRQSLFFDDASRLRFELFRRDVLSILPHKIAYRGIAC